MKLKDRIATSGPLALRKSILSVAVLALSSQIMLIGLPEPTPINLFNPDITT